MRRQRGISPSLADDVVLVAHNEQTMLYYAGGKAKPVNNTW